MTFEKLRTFSTKRHNFRQRRRGRRRYDESLSQRPLRPAGQRSVHSTAGGQSAAAVASRPQPVDSTVGQRSSTVKHAVTLEFSRQALGSLYGSHH